MEMPEWVERRSGDIVKCGFCEVETTIVVVPEECPHCHHSGKMIKARAWITKGVGTKIVFYCSLTHLVKFTTQILPILQERGGMEVRLTVIETRREGKSMTTVMQTEASLTQNDLFYVAGRLPFKFSFVEAKKVNLT